MAAVARFVNTASTAGGDGTTNNTSGATRAYASLSEWEANGGGSATDDYSVDCSGTAADTTAVTLNFTPTITSGSITIRGNRSSGTGFYSGTSVISTSFYRLAIGSGASGLTLQQNNITVDGIQVTSGGGAFRSAINIQGAVAFTLKKNRVFASAACDSGIGSGGTGNGDSGTKVIENNLVVGFNLSQIEMVVGNFRTPTFTVRQNTCYGDGSSAGILISEGSSAAGSYTIAGNAIGNSGASNCFSVTLVSGAVIYDDNATEDAQGTTGEIAIGTLSNAWTNPGVLTSSDFTVKNTSSSLYNVVNPTLVTDDITDATRSGTNHDVGCYMYVAAAAALCNPFSGRGGAAAQPLNG